MHRPADVLRRALIAAAVLIALAGRPLLGEEEWRLPGLKGGALTAAEVAHGTTVMVVWAGWSPRCANIVERSNHLVDSFEARARVVLVDFQEEPGEVQGFLAGKSVRAPIYLDGDGAFAKQHRVTTLPGLVVYREGTIVYQGRFPDDVDKVLGDLIH